MRNNRTGGIQLLEVPGFGSVNVGYGCCGEHLRCDNDGDDGSMASEMKGPQIIKRPRVHHGLWQTHKSEWQAWVNVWRRCYDPRVECFHNYGGRGITLCERWHSFSNFLADLGPKPSDGNTRYTLERINNDGNYEPSNCRWATYTENLNNTRRNRRWTINGDTFTTAQLAKRSGILISTLSVRLHRGLSIEEALSRPVIPRQRRAS